MGSNSQIASQTTRNRRRTSYHVRHTRSQKLSGGYRGSGGGRGADSGPAGAPQHPAHHDGPAAVGHHRRPLAAAARRISTGWRSQGMLFERSYTPSAVCCPARAMLLSGAYHWHNGVYNQVHSPPSVHRDMNPDVVLYSQRLRDAGYRLGYTGKWHASYLRTPLDFGFHEIAAVAGCDPDLLENLDHQSRPRPARHRSLCAPRQQRMMRWPGSEPFAMWGYREGPEESTPEYRTAELASRMMKRFAQGRAAVAPGSPLRRASRPLHAAEAVPGPLRSARHPRAEELRRHLRRQARPAPPRIGDLGRASPKTTYARAARTTTPTPSSSTRRSGACSRRSTKPARPTARWSRSPPITATWWARIACGSKAGSPTRSAIACR